MAYPGQHDDWPLLLDARISASCSVTFSARSFIARPRAFSRLARAAPAWNRCSNVQISTVNRAGPLSRRRAEDDRACAYSLPASLSWLTSRGRSFPLPSSSTEAKSRPSFV